METPETQIAITPKYLPVKTPRFMPALPVWDEHLDAYILAAQSFACNNAEDFEAAKALRGNGTKLRGDITTSFVEPKRMIDEMKQPFLDAENTCLAKLKPAIANIDATATAWKLEQDRIAQAKAEISRQEEIARREAARQEEIKRLEAERTAEIARVKAQTEIASEWEDVPSIESETLNFPPVIVPEIVQPRRVTIESEFKSARGVRNKPKLVVRVVDPDLVGRAYCSPDPIRYQARVKACLAVIQDPTKEQIQKIADQIGGVEISFE